MPGGASTRQYFRVVLANAKVASAVAMFVPDGHAADEIDKSGRRRRWPFLEVHDLLRERGVDVPELYAEDPENGWLLLEDLGDDTLAGVLLREPEHKTALYTRAVQDLAHAQAHLGALPSDSIVTTRAFDEDLLFWELEHFRQWGIEARGKSFANGDAIAFDAIARRLAARVAAFPRGFTHRDYQSRNLMVRVVLPEPRFVWIDFQDALMGPRVYDLVSLLNDSYQEFTPAFVAARLDDYAAEAKLDAASRTALAREFDLVTVQRKLKDAGRFVFINNVKGNASFLPYVLPTVGKAMAALERLGDEPEMVRLAQILARAAVAS
jgi:N-acetylmuramate 1-kinase